MNVITIGTLRGGRSNLPLRPFIPQPFEKASKSFGLVVTTSPSHGEGREFEPRIDYLTVIFFFAINSSNNLKPHYIRLVTVLSIPKR
jgi:hypothetical protein